MRSDAKTIDRSICLSVKYKIKWKNLVTLYLVQLVLGEVIALLGLLTLGPAYIVSGIVVGAGFGLCGVVLVEKNE